jgi:hypothetical protein
MKGASFSFKKKSIPRTGLEKEAQRNMPFCTPVFSNISGNTVPHFRALRGPAHFLDGEHFRFAGFAGQTPPLLEKFQRFGDMADKKAFLLPARVDDLNNIFSIPIAIPISNTRSLSVSVSITLYDFNFVRFLRKGRNP